MVAGDDASLWASGKMSRQHGSSADTSGFPGPCLFYTQDPGHDSLRLIFVAVSPLPEDFWSCVF